METVEEEVVGEVEEEEVAEEKRGFTLEIKDALTTDDKKITEDNALETEETFILELEGNLDADHNYEAEDKITFNLPESVVVAKAVNDVTAVGNNNVANYIINNNGTEINYTVTENTVTDYTANIERLNADNEFVVTNSHTPNETYVAVTKSWNDSNNQDGNRPESIEVQLTANGEPVGEPVEVLASEDWTYTWTGLDENVDGTAINYSVEELNVVEDYTASINDADHGNIILTNSYTPQTTEIPVTKVWDDKDNQDDVRPNDVTVNLLNGSEIEKTAVLNEANDWQYTFTELPVYDNGNEINYTVTENTVAEYSTSITDGVVTNSYTPDETTATVTKLWTDGNNQDGNRPGSVLVQLLADGESYGEPVEVTAEDGWTYTWEDLDLNENGEAIDYTVEELDVAERYVVSYNNDDHGSLVINNAYTPEVTEVSVSKEWDDADNQDGVRPENVTINLLADGEIERTTIVNAEGEWQHTFTDLPVYNNGNEINYTITENTVTDYTANIERLNADDEFVVTNSHTPNETSVTVTKSWNDSNNQDGNRPESVEFQLTANGEPKGEPVEVTAEDWTYTWTGLDANADGLAIQYSVVELSIAEGYEAAVNDREHGNIIITNTYSPELIDIPVLKVWDDKDDQDRVRPDRVEVNLLADGEKIKEAHITEGTDWHHVFTDLPRYKDGQEIVYTLNENNIEGYSLTNNELNEDTGNTELTNSYTPEETSATVTKAWNNNQNDDLPASVSVQLLANGEPEGEPVEVTAENDWTYTWTGLALNSDGEAINYTVEEIEVTAGYDVSYNNEDHGNLIITNTSVPRVSVGDYVWIDENRDGLQDDTDTPLENVELILTDSEGNRVTDIYGNVVGPTTTDENGYYTFDNLPIDNVYTVTINKEKFEELYPELSPTESNVGNDNSVDSSTWTVDSVLLDEDGQRDPTLDFGFVTPEEPVVPEPETPSVSVGDYVWIDENRDGLQDDTDTPLKGVELSITDSEGNPVIDVFGNPVGPTTTDENGFYTFYNLPIDTQYIVTINQEKFKELYPELAPTLSNVGNDNSIDSSTWTATSIFLDEDGQRDPTLDFGFVTPEEEPEVPVDPETPSGSVGDYVWHDKNDNGKQDKDEPGIPGVVLVITDEDGNEVTDVNGNVVGPVTTDENGGYIFDNLPLGKKYVVSIDKDASKEALKGFAPAKENVGNRDTDSSTWTVMSVLLDEDGQHDPTLDFGFVTPEPSEPVTPGEDDKPEEPGKTGIPSEDGKSGEPSKDGTPADPKEDENLPDTGEAQNTTLYLGGFMSLLAGAALIFITRRKNNEEQ